MSFFVGPGVSALNQTRRPEMTGKVPPRRFSRPARAFDMTTVSTIECSTTGPEASAPAVQAAATILSLA